MPTKTIEPETIGGPSRDALFADHVGRQGRDAQPLLENATSELPDEAKTAVGDVAIWDQVMWGSEPRQSGEQIADSQPFALNPVMMPALDESS